MASPRAIDLLAYGDPNADHIYLADRVPLADEKLLGRKLGVFGGGTAANVACAATRLGLKTAAFGRVGADADGTMLLAENAKLGISNDYMTVSDDPTASAMIIVNADGEKALVYAPMPGIAFDELSLTTAVQQARVVYAMPYDIVEFTAISRLARANGCLVAIDIEAAVAPNRGRLEALLTLSDIVFMNEPGFLATSAEPLTPDAVVKLLDFGPQLITVTRAAEGAISVSRDQALTQSSFPTSLVDATGAGDCFNGAFLAAHLAGASLAETLRFACAAAAISVSAVGARTALPDIAQVQAKLSA
ncbi:carbohydrate kinase family protein [Devosia sp. WQ 349]|uniref:carbohydrate kinase family protein n=1 Tax=Devosia sp. WQ 349K1 TaxID=2800329 RepID=UPI001903C23B|nr:carbohydrate kinase family protein [Devosia sp. WQ 349K1]MBK1795621.1 carbohydrate kinase family protein [Devosia sp. WQ 349K1]